MALVGLSMIGEVCRGGSPSSSWCASGGSRPLRFWVIRHGVMPASRGGKLKTLLQTFGIGFYLLPRWTLPFPELWNWVAAVSLGAAVVVTVVTGVDYLVQALRLRQTSERAMRKRRRACRSVPPPARGARHRDRAGPTGPPRRRVTSGRSA